MTRRYKPGDRHRAILNFLQEFAIMTRWYKLVIGILLFFHATSPAFSLEVAPRLTDREIIESLAELKQGQRDINKRFGDINARFVDINARFGDINARFGDIDKRFGDLDKRFGDIDKRFGDLDKSFGDIDKRFGGIDKRFVDVNKRIDDLRQDMNKRFAELRQDMNKRFDDVNKRIDTSHQTMLAMFGTLITLIVTLFGYIAWDRRTLVKPLQEKLNTLEQHQLRETQSLQENTSHIQNLMQALRKLAQEDQKLASVLRSYSLL